MEYSAQHIERIQLSNGPLFVKQGRRIDTVEEKEYIPIMLSYGGLSSIT